MSAEAYVTMSEGSCQKCQAPAFRTELARVYTALPCMAHVQAWSVFCLKQQVFQDLNYWEHQRSVFFAESHWRDVRSEFAEADQYVFKLRQKMMTIAQRWVAGEIPRSAEADARSHL